MAGLVIPAVWLLILAAVWRRSMLPFRDCILVAAAIAGGVTAFGSDVLSTGLFLFLGFEGVLEWWCFVGAVSIAFLIRPGRPFARPRPRIGFWFELAPMIVIVVVAVTTLVTICYCPPNNWDVILYHLPRQVQWLQWGGVQHFPTQDWRLTVNPPFLEYAGAHVMALTESDRFYAALSWLAMLLTLLAVSVLARDLGANRTGQWLAAAFAATVPMSVHEAVTGKNDGTVALWLVMLATQFLKLWTAEVISKKRAALFGLTLGLLALTKGTGLVFASPVLLLISVKAIYRRPRGFWTAAILAVAVAGLLNKGHVSRNMRHYGSPSGQTFSLANETHEPAAMASNVLRNIVMHLATPREKWNRQLEQFVVRQHRWLGITSDDSRTTWGGGTFVVEHVPHQEHAAAPLHFVVGLISVLVVLSDLSWHRLLACANYKMPAIDDTGWKPVPPKGMPEIRWCPMLLAVLVTGAALAFCFVFKWQPWHPRLHLPLFCLAAPLVGLVFSARRWVVLSPLLSIALLGTCLPALFQSELRPLVGHGSILHADLETLRFHGREDVRRAAKAMVDQKTGNIAMINHGAFPWEYPLTRLLKSDYRSGRVLAFYPVQDRQTHEVPLAGVIAIGDTPAAAWVRRPQTGETFVAVTVAGPFTLYRPAVAPPGTTFETAIGRFGVGAEPISQNEIREGPP